MIAPRYPEFASPAEADVERVLSHHGVPLSAPPRILRTLRSAPPDSILLAADIRSVMLAYALSPLHRRPYRAVIHGSEVAKLQSANPLFAIARRAYRGAEMLAANSKATLRLFEEAMGQHHRAVVTCLGVSASWFEPPAGTFEHPELAALPAGEPVVCTVGRIEARKGHLEAVEAIARCRDAHGVRSPAFVMAGRPENPEYLAAVLDLGRQRKVRLIQPGILSEADIRRLYRRAACSLLAARRFPGRIEGFGLVLLEAGAQGCPSVATRVGGIPEAMGKGGTLVDENDIDGIARAIGAYVLDADKRERDGHEARENAKRFSWNACARSTFPELAWPAQQ